MAQYSKKVNFMISDEIRREFEELVPPGTRSKVVNEALKKELISIKRRKLTDKLLQIRLGSQKVSTEEIVEAIRVHRARNGS